MKKKAPCLVVILGLGIPLCALLCCCGFGLLVYKEANVKGQFCDSFNFALKYWDPFKLCH